MFKKLLLRVFVAQRRDNFCRHVFGQPLKGPHLDLYKVPSRLLILAIGAAKTSSAPTEDLTTTALFRRKSREVLCRYGETRNLTTKLRLAGNREAGTATAASLLQSQDTVSFKKL